MKKEREREREQRQTGKSTINQQCKSFHQHCCARTSQQPTRSRLLSTWRSITQAFETGSSKYPGFRDWVLQINFSVRNHREDLSLRLGSGAFAIFLSQPTIKRALAANTLFASCFGCAPTSVSRARSHQVRIDGMFPRRMLPLPAYSSRTSKAPRPRGRS